jgi:Rrf2 family protein
MFLTKEYDYGARIIRALADGTKKTMDQICQSEYIPGQYAYKILKKLERAAFLEIIRGRDGGYRLSRPLDTFTFHDIIMAIDDNLFVFECLRGDKGCPFKNAQRPCTVHKELERIQRQMIEELQKKTMSEVLSYVGG